MRTLPPEEAKAFYAKMDAAMLTLFSQCVVPIYAAKDDTPIQCGTGTLPRAAVTLNGRAGIVDFN